jgi:ABC-type cobalamin transport system ATPase subunit
VALVSELARQVSACSNGVVHVHGCHGSGKSSLLANFSKEVLLPSPGVMKDAAACPDSSVLLFLRHFFIRNDAAASVEIAVRMG